jgi:DinB family
VSALDSEHLAERIDFTFTDGAPGRMSREEMLMRVITHGTGHRGQVSAVMLLNCVPPAKDGFTTYLHEAEVSTRGRSCRVNAHRVAAITCLGGSGVTAWDFLREDLLAELARSARSRHSRSRISCHLAAVRRSR